MNKKELITKSDFTTGMKCPKLLWYKRNRKDLLPATDMGHAEEGKCVGELAKGLFGNVVTVTGVTIAERIKKTQDLIVAGIPIIAEAAFLSDGLYCQVDILANKGDVFEINEVKAVTSIRTKKGALEKTYLYDAGFQHYVVSRTGLPINKVNIVHLNSDYRRKGSLNISKLFVIDDVTDEITSWAITDNQVEDNVARIRNFLSTNTVEPDDSSMNTNCASLSDPCPMRDRCMSQLECCDVWNLCGTFCKPPTKLKLFKEGIRSFSELEKSGRIQSEVCKRHISAEITGDDFVDKDAICEFLSKIWYPIAYLDFETYKLAIPEYDDQWPHEQMPFQYSLDIVMKPGDKLEHKEFLGEENKDPRRNLAEKLIRDIPKGSCVIVYNDSFEKLRLKELSELYPDLASELDEISENVRDLMVPFKNADYYTKNMKRSFSIKKVLPALFPGDPSLDYSKLPGVQNGKEAMNRFLELRDMDDDNRKREREGMLKYCGLDTYAMVKVHEALMDAAK